MQRRAGEGQESAGISFIELQGDAPAPLAGPGLQHPELGLPRQRVEPEGVVEEGVRRRREVDAGVAFGCRDDPGERELPQLVAEPAEQRLCCGGRRFVDEDHPPPPGPGFPQAPDEVRQIDGLAGGLSIQGDGGGPRRRLRRRPQPQAAPHQLQEDPGIGHQPALDEGRGSAGMPLAELVGELAEEGRLPRSPLTDQQDVAAVLDPVRQTRQLAVPAAEQLVVRRRVEQGPPGQVHG